MATATYICPKCGTEKTVNSVVGLTQSEFLATLPTRLPCSNCGNEADRKQAS